MLGGDVVVRFFSVPETAIRTGPSGNSGAPYWPEFSDEPPGRITPAVSGT